MVIVVVIVVIVIVVIVVIIIDVVIIVVIVDVVIVIIIVVVIVIVTIVVCWVVRNKKVQEPSNQLLFVRAWGGDLKQPSSFPQIISTITVNEVRFILWRKAIQSVNNLV